MIIEDLDVMDDEAFADWHSVYAACYRLARPDEPSRTAEELKVTYRDDSDYHFANAIARDESGRAIGYLVVELPRHDNLQHAFVMMGVHPSFRRQGVGRALIARAERSALEHGRHIVMADSDEPAGGDDSAIHFAQALGYTAGLRLARRQLKLPIPGERFAALETASTPFATGYEIITWIGRCPDAWRTDRAELSRVISRDAPSDDLDIEEETWDDDRLARFEQSVEDMDRDLLSAGAVHVATGQMVGFTELALPRGDQEVARQRDTVVQPEHRGHRLGMILKLTNIRVLGEWSPATTRVITGNAVSNDPMISVNEAIGFELLGFGTGWQKTLA